MREVCMKCGEELKKENMVIDIDTCLCEECYQYAKEEKDMCNHCEYFKFDAEYSDYRECVNKESEYKGMNLWNLPIDMACEYYEPLKINNEDIRVFGEPKFRIGDRVKVINPYSGYYGDIFFIKSFEFKESEYVYKIGTEIKKGGVSTWKNEKEIEIVTSKHDRMNEIDSLIEMLTTLRRKIGNDTIDSNTTNEIIGTIIEDLNELKI